MHCREFFLGKCADPLTNKIDPTYGETERAKKIMIKRYSLNYLEVKICKIMKQYLVRLIRNFNPEQCKKKD